MDFLHASGLGAAIICGALLWRRFARTRGDRHVAMLPLLVLAGIAGHGVRVAGNMLDPLTGLAPDSWPLGYVTAALVGLAVLKLVYDRMALRDRRDAMFAGVTMGLIWIALALLRDLPRLQWRDSLHVVDMTLPVIFSWLYGRARESGKSGWPAVGAALFAAALYWLGSYSVREPRLGYSVFAALMLAVGVLAACQPPRATATAGD